MYTHTHTHPHVHAYLLTEEEREGKESVCTRSFDVPACFCKLSGMSVENKLAMRVYQLTHAAATGTGA